MRFATRVIHKGQKPDPVTGAVISPVYMTSTYVQESPGQHKGYDYTRAGNPNFTNLEQQMASLEGAEHATVFSSGLGGTTALCSLFQAGDTVVATRGLYGGTFRLFTKFFERFGIHFEFVDGRDFARCREIVTSMRARMLFIESPSNPLLEVVDLSSLCSIARDAGALAVVDNTFCSPYFQNPLELGAHAVMHSSTKYLGGHSDVIGGVVMTSDADLKERLDFARMSMGLNPSPFDAWLTSRGVKTLAVRMEKHQENGRAVAEYFSKHPMVERLYYPMLSGDANYELASKQMRGFGGMVSLDLKLDLKKSEKFVSSLKYFQLAESLGGVESLVCHPASMTHASIPKETREAIGLADGLVRLSVGIEDVEDLIEDLDQGLKGI